MQPVLRLPRDLFHFGAGGRLALPQGGADCWSVSIGPGRFDDDTTQMRVARFRNAAAPRPVAARILARHGTAVAHQLSWFGKAREFADLPQS
jgi:hypothetical protein